jgi:hypothetical protein
MSRFFGQEHNYIQRRRLGFASLLRNARPTSRGLTNLTIRFLDDMHRAPHDGFYDKETNQPERSPYSIVRDQIEEVDLTCLILLRNAN